jgi:hypothetical protein
MFATVCLAVFVVSACRDGPPAPEFSNVVLIREAGDAQRAPGLARLDVPLGVRAVDRESREGIAGLSVRFAIDRGASTGAQVSDAVAITDHSGIARTDITLGPDPIDTLTVVAQLGRGPHTTFTVLVTPTPVVRSVTPPLIRAGDTVEVRGTALGIAAAPGVVRFRDTPGTTLSVSDSLVRAVVPPCLPAGITPVTITNGGARSTAGLAHSARSSATRLALAPLEGVTLRAEQLADCVELTGAGARYVAVPHFGIYATAMEELEVEVGAGPPAQGFSASPFTAASRLPAMAFESMLRARESMFARAGATSRAAIARAAATQHPVVGSLRSLRVISKIDASEFATVTARLRYAGPRVVIWVDTVSPDVLPDTSLTKLGRLFDDELYPLGVETFGEASDVDGDGRVHVVMTPVVNGLTPSNQCTLSGFVGAFFTAHDLYPGTPNANGGEFLYAFVPDSLGRYGCPHTRTEFGRVMPKAFVHELQHAINYHQHVRRGGTEEEIWLNEGLSHAAEEIASKLYEARYPWPAGRATPDLMFPDSANAYIFFNLVNAYLFLRQPFANSVTSFREGGTIEERGGAWLFLRWLADQYGEGILGRLVRTHLRGAANVVDKTRAPFAQTMGDFAIAVYADSIPGLPRTSVPAKWRFHSRNLRVLFNRLNEVANFPPFPIELIDVPHGGVAFGSLRAGGFAFLSVHVPANAQSTMLRFARRSGAPWAIDHAPQISVIRLP